MHLESLRLSSVVGTYTLPQKGRFRQFCFLFGCQGAKSRLRRLERSKKLDKFRFLGGSYLVSLDGTGYFRSQAIQLFLLSAKGQQAERRGDLLPPIDGLA